MRPAPAPVARPRRGDRLGALAARLRGHIEAGRRVGWRFAARRAAERLWHSSFPLRVLYFAGVLPQAAAARLLHVASRGRLARRAPARWRRLLRFDVPRPAAPGMTRPEEQCFLRDYARRDYRGRGAIVDVGCFLGATTLALAKGVARNPRARTTAPPVHAFDRFVWEEWMDPAVAGTELAGRFRAGESFREDFERRLGRWRPLVRTHAVDLRAGAWSSGPIELLVVDAMKSWELMNAIHRMFLPSLLPREGIVVHQDFAHVHTPWIHLGLYRLRDVLESVEHVPRSGSHVFRLRRAVPPERAALPLARSDFSAEEVEAAFEASLSVTPPDLKPNVAAARVMLHLQSGELGAAERALAAFRARGLPGVDDLAWVEDELVRRERGGDGASPL